jgi:hypothetical protein
VFVDKDMILAKEHLQPFVVLWNVNKRSSNIHLFVYIMKKQSNTFNHHLFHKNA